MIAPPSFVHYAQMGKKEEGRKVGVTHVRVLQAEGGRRLHLHGACQNRAQRCCSILVLSNHVGPIIGLFGIDLYSTVCSPCLA